MEPVKNIRNQVTTDSGNVVSTQHPWHRFVAMGDSFTQGFGDPDPLSLGGYRGWADRVAEELDAGHGDFSYANLAFQGQTVRQVIDTQLRPALRLAPDLVSFQAGGNDLIHLGADPDRLAATIEPAIEALASAGATVILFLGPDSGRQTVLGHVRTRIALYNEDLRAIAAHHGAIVADMWSLKDLSDARMWSADRLHPSPLGHQQVASMVLDSLHVPHDWAALTVKPLPVRSWRQLRAGDIVWTRQYLLPWILRAADWRAEADSPAPKRPVPGPVRQIDAAPLGGT